MRTLVGGGCGARNAARPDQADPDTPKAVLGKRVECTGACLARGEDRLGYLEQCASCSRIVRFKNLTVRLMRNVGSSIASALLDLLLNDLQLQIGLRSAREVREASASMG